MAAQIIDGARIAAEIRQELAAEAQALRARGIVPCLAVVLVGDNPASTGRAGRAGADGHASSASQSRVSMIVRIVWRNFDA